MEKTITNHHIQIYLKVRPELRRFLISLGVHLRLITKIHIFRQTHEEKLIFTTYTSVKYSPEVTYTVSGKHFKVVIERNLNTKAIRLKSLYNAQNKDLDL